MTFMAGLQKQQSFASSGQPVDLLLLAHNYLKILKAELDKRGCWADPASSSCGSPSSPVNYLNP